MLRAGLHAARTVATTTPTTKAKMPLHHLMIGTWTPPGAIFTVQFDDEALTLKLIKRTEIALDEPISWMTFDVSSPPLHRQFEEHMTDKIRSMPKRICMAPP